VGTWLMYEGGESLGFVLVGVGVLLVALKVRRHDN
jgi:hypothetical protein